MMLELSSVESRTQCEGNSRDHKQSGFHNNIKDKTSTSSPRQNGRVHLLRRATMKYKIPTPPLPQTTVALELTACKTMEMSGHPPVPCTPPTSSFTLDELSSFHERMPSVQSAWLAVPVLQVLWMLQKGGDVWPERLPSLAGCFPGFHPWWVTCQFLSYMRRSMSIDYIQVSWAWGCLSHKWHF